ncbi:MAG: RNA polymerase sigma factor [Bacteroidota bacterium]
MAQIDPLLLQQCLQKDQRAQSKLFELCFGFLMPICLRYANCRDDAQSYLNLGFYKILRNLKKLPPDAPFIAWARRVQINAILDELRKDKRYRERIQVSDHQQIPEKHQTIDYDMLTLEAEDIHQMIRSLPPTTATVFNLYAIDGYKHREIAKMLKIPEGSSKWHYSEAKKRLQKMILHTQMIKKKVAS